MQLTKLNPSILNSIKILSTILITGALILELWVQINSLSHQVINPVLKPIILIERIALLGHFFEAILAAYWSQNSRIKAGIYTFFTGTVGLLELWKQSEILDTTKTQRSQSS